MIVSFVQEKRGEGEEEKKNGGFIACDWKKGNGLWGRYRDGKYMFYL